MAEKMFVEWIKVHRKLLENLRSDGVLTPYTIKNMDEALEEL
jgi:hypothetical protein